MLCNVVPRSFRAAILGPLIGLVFGLTLTTALGDARISAGGHCATQASAALARDCETLLGL